VSEWVYKVGNYIRDRSLYSINGIISYGEKSSGIERQTHRKLGT
jgi:hypothetical protein